MSHPLQSKLSNLTAPVLFGIVNLTPDSFSDGAPGVDALHFLKCAEQLMQDGADVLDLGAESTRPNSEPVSADEELRRLKPFLDLFRARHPVFPISIDTQKFEVAKQLIPYRYQVLNDVGFLADVRLMDLVREFDLNYILMHSRGDSKNMMSLTRYENGLFQTLRDEITEKLKVIESCRVDQSRVILDLGFGFAKDQDQCHELVQNLDYWQDMPHAKMLGISRKRFLQRYTGETSPLERDPISAELACLAFKNGFRIIRTHNVALTRQLLQARVLP